MKDGTRVWKARTVPVGKRLARFDAPARTLARLLPLAGAGAGAGVSMIGRDDC